jgi:hypothetical protein
MTVRKTPLKQPASQSHRLLNVEQNQNIAL